MEGMGDTESPTGSTFVDFVRAQMKMYDGEGCTNALIPDCRDIFPFLQAKRNDVLASAER